MKTLLNTIWIIGLIALVLSAPFLKGAAIGFLTLWFCVFGKLMQLFVWESHKGNELIINTRETIAYKVVVYRHKFYKTLNRHRSDFVTLWLKQELKDIEITSIPLEFYFTTNYNYKHKVKQVNKPKVKKPMKIKLHSKKLLATLALTANVATAQPLELTKKENIECAAAYLTSTSVYEMAGSTHKPEYTILNEFYKLYESKVSADNLPEVDALASKYFVSESYTELGKKLAYCKEMAYRYYL